MDIRKGFGKNLRRIRNQSDMSQEDLAFFIGVTPSALSYLENGKSFVSAKLLGKICEVLRVQPSELFDFNEIKPDAEAEEIIRTINYTLSGMSTEKLKYINKIVRVLANKD